MKQHIKKIEKTAKKIKLSLREKKHLSNVPRSNGFYFQIGLVVVLVLMFGLFQMKFDKKELVIDKPVIDMISEENIDPPDFVIEQEIPVELLEQFHRVHIQELIAIEVVEDDADVLPTVIYDSSIIVRRAPRIADVNVLVIEDEVEPIPVSLVSNVPVFPGCEKFSTKKMKIECMSEKIKKHVIKKFNTDIAIEFGIEGRQKALVTFVVNTNGEVVNVKARAPHPELQKEVVKIVSSLPKMKPAQQGFKHVSVTYALPVIFQVE